MKLVGAVELSWSTRRCCLRKEESSLSLSRAMGQKQRRQRKEDGHQNNCTPPLASCWDLQPGRQGETGYSSSASRSPTGELWGFGFPTRLVRLGFVGKIGLPASTCADDASPFARCGPLTAVSTFSVTGSPVFFRRRLGDAGPGRWRRASSD